MLRSALRTAQYLLQHPLSRQRPVRSLVRYARWQISSRMAIGPIAVDFVDDARLLVEPGMTGATGNIYVGLHEYEDMAFVLHALRRDDLFVDVGANVGSYTVLAAKAAAANTVAFEPIDSAFRVLRDNIALNAIGDRVDAKQVCVGAEAGVVTMTRHFDSSNHVVHERDVGNDAAQVPVTTLDRALDGRSPFMIKLDVEGYELAALRGASRTLADPTLQCLLIEMGHNGLYGHTDAAMVELVRSHGFSRFAYMPAERRLAATDDLHSGNGIFVRDHELVRRRVQEARSFRVLDRAI